MKKVVLTFGLIAGAMLSAMMLATIPFMEQIGFDKGMVIGYTTMVLSFLMVFFGIKSYRDNVAGGSITFGRGFKVGILITVIASTCYVATWQLVFYKLSPDFFEKYAAYEMDKMRRAGAPEAKLEEMKKGMAEFNEMYKNPLVNASITFLEPLPVGLLFTLGSAWGLSRRRRESVAQVATP